jgi:hypothetical protein
VHGVCAIAVAEGIKLAGPDGTGSLVLTQDTIAFNGVGDEAHESFWIDRVPEAPAWKSADSEKEKFFSFCKTANKPYDPVVVAALCLLDDTGGFHKICSDGNHSDWQAGLELARKVLARAQIPSGVSNE